MSYADIVIIPLIVIIFMLGANVRKLRAQVSTLIIHERRQRAIIGELQQKTKAALILADNHNDFIDKIKPVILPLLSRGQLNERFGKFSTIPGGKSDKS